MIDAESLRPKKSHQLNPKEKEEDRKYLDEVHEFIDQEYDALLAEIGDVKSPRSGTLGKGWVEDRRREAHQYLEHPFTFGPAYWLHNTEVFDQGVVAAMRARKQYREDWGVEAPETDLPKRETVDPPTSWHIETQIRKDRGY